MPACEIFTPRLPQATRLHAQHPLQRVSRRLANLSYAREGEVLAFPHQDNLGCGISQIFQQGDDVSGCLVRIGCGENAFCDSLLNDLREPRRESFDSGKVEFMAEEGVLISIPDAQKREHQVEVLSFVLIEHSKKTHEF